MGFTLEQYEALVKAIIQGAVRVKYADKEVEYRSLDEMLRLKLAMEKDLGITQRGIRTTYAKFSKGL